tara:strand:+ start:2087 stop:3220 length:1134 start_codon:yes stop_codon:yes gene_type:complete
MGSPNTNIGVKQIKKYIKIPDRRLISGLLYVNVVNHLDNDASSDDFIQTIADAGSVPDTIGHSNAFSDNASDFHNPGTENRAGFRQSFADYDCFVFYVCGGMSLTGGVFNPHSDYRMSMPANGVTEGLLVADGSGGYKWTADGNLGGVQASWNTADANAVWYLDAKPGDKCTHFIKHHLISRVNNGSGHVKDDTAGELFYKHRGQPKVEYRASSIHNESTGAVDKVPQYVLSHGIYDIVDTQGTSIGEGGLATIPEDPDDLDSNVLPTNLGDFTGDDPNTYFAPVDKIAIYGTHRFVPISHTTTADGGHTCWSTNHASAVHVSDWWDLVIDIGIRGNNTGTSSWTTTKQLFKTQTNVFFQPFGETADFDISDTAHTS